MVFELHNAKTCCFGSGLALWHSWIVRWEGALRARILLRSHPLATALELEIGGACSHARALGGWGRERKGEILAFVELGPYAKGARNRFLRAS